MKKTFVAALWFLSLAASFLAGRHSGSPAPETIVLTHTDTVRVVCPEVTAIYVRGKATERLPVSSDSLRTDSADVIVPISQAIYVRPDYRAYVSGFRPKLDSLIFTERHYETRIAAPQKERRWSIGLQAGYGITPRGLQPFIGIGVSFRIY